MEEQVIIPRFIPKKINGLWYWSDFARWVSKNFWPGAHVLEAFFLGLALIGFVVILGYVGLTRVVRK
ncbi:hypothetical protein ES702_01918 [subsurface metagenome]